MHIPYRDNKQFTGTARYSSLNTHLGMEQSRRDDMECLAYTFIYLLKGQLPWQGFKNENRKDRYEYIKDTKKNMKIEDVCKDLPTQFYKYLHYCRRLKFEDKPDYSKLKKTFKNLFYSNHYDVNFGFDWVFLNALTVEETFEFPNLSATNLADCPSKNCLSGKEAKIQKSSDTSLEKKIMMQSVLKSSSQAVLDMLNKLDEPAEFKSENPLEESKESPKISVNKKLVQPRLYPSSSLLPIKTLFHAQAMENLGCNFNEDDIVEHAIIRNLLLINR